MKEANDLINKIRNVKNDVERTARDVSRLPNKIDNAAKGVVRDVKSYGNNITDFAKDAGSKIEDAFKLPTEGLEKKLDKIFEPPTF